MKFITGCGLAVYMGLFVAPAQAIQADLDVLYKECKPQLKLSERGCRCISSTAAKELGDKQQAFVAAMVTQNQAKTGALRGQLSPKDMTKAMEFMLNAPQKCAGK